VNGFKYALTPPSHGGLGGAAGGFFVAIYLHHSNNSNTKEALIDKEILIICPILATI